MNGKPTAPPSPTDPTNGLWGRTRKWFSACTEKDTPVVLAVIVLAILLRVPFISHPESTVFDEAIYANFSIHTIDGEPFFDIHPPLARLFFAKVAHLVPFEAKTVRIWTNESFGDFPYVLVRLFVSFFGMLLPLILYAIGRRIGYAPRIAALPALFMLFDGAFIVYSRAMLPDLILLSFGFLGILAALAAASSAGGTRRWTLAALAGCTLGLAVATKWTALGLFGTAALIFLLARMYREMVLCALVSFVVYVLVFVSFLSHFPAGGVMDPVLATYNKSWVTAVPFPNSSELGDPQALTTFLLSYHRTMLAANRDPETIKYTLRAPGALAWPSAKSAIALWQNTTKDRQIILRGNSLLWFATLFVLIFNLAWIGARVFHERLWPVDRAEGILLIGYAMNYLPFFFIERSMYLYHYFAAVIFLFLLLPRVVPRIKECIVCVTGDRLLADVLIRFVALLIFIGFLAQTPTTYGF